MTNSELGTKKPKHGECNTLYTNGDRYPKYVRILHRFADSVHAFVQPSRQAPASKVVYATDGEKQEEA